MSALDIKDMCVLDPIVLPDKLLTEADEVGVSTAPVVVSCACSPWRAAVEMDNDVLGRLTVEPSVDVVEAVTDASPVVALAVAMSVRLGL